ncbi:helix-turn-helix domain-containing protein [Nocardia sp. NBC_00565]|uniref:ArsR/SmtB family transcription factor n=1 Tax=Nocardia sp. NBC_00565 TaxID=2975993 RepID=UPI002E815F5F|nr:helix-turn-helix domain-containing protein [Nocardia sp. NBC_00565]WUC07843.1 helix-turn-helix domain-containing protein [Nocardia sp. NBC_00565]
MTAHPERTQIQLANVLAAMGSPLRLRIVRVLADGGEHTCGSIVDGVAKSNLTHHYRVLREAGIIWQRPSGRETLQSLRRDDLDARFPGLLDALIDAACLEAAAEV